MQEPQLLNEARDPGRVNLDAFLALIRSTEGSDPNPKGWNPYAVTYAYAFEIQDFTLHPSDPARGRDRWRGVPLPDEMCRDAGFSPGCVSTAAGAYQINWPTWRHFAPIAAVTDFSWESQDRVCVEILMYEGAYESILAGRVDLALPLAGRRWASLPHAKTKKQPKVTLTRAYDIYTGAGGVITPPPLIA